jgi:hypothetical protein
MIMLIVMIVMILIIILILTVILIVIIIMCTRFQLRPSSGVTRVQPCTG